MWNRTKVADGGEIMTWRADQRTASLIEKRITIAVDEETGTVHLAYVHPEHGVTTIVLPPAGARTIGTALIEGGLIAGQSVTR